MKLWSLRLVRFYWISIGACQGGINSQLPVMSLCLSYRVDVITILEITVRLWRPNYQARSLSLSLPVSLVVSSSLQALLLNQVHPAVISWPVEPN